MEGNGKKSTRFAKRPMGTRDTTGTVSRTKSPSCKTIREGLHPFFLTHQFRRLLSTAAPLQPPSHRPFRAAVAQSAAKVPFLIKDWDDSGGTAPDSHGIPC
jgi:hypothetical protein